MQEIAPTPKLNATDTEIFLKKVEEGLKNPVGLVPTPKLDTVIKQIMRDARRKKKE